MPWLRPSSMKLRRPTTPAERNFACVTSLIAGFGIIAISAGLFPKFLSGLHAPLWVVFAAGVVFTLTGIVIGVQERAPAWLSGLLVSLLLSAFAAIPAWVAWDGGQRTFAGFGLSLIALLNFDSASAGRAVFAFSALFMLAFAVVAWWTWLAKLSWSQRSVLVPAVCAAAYALLVLVPAEPRWGDVHDDHERLARYALLSQREGWNALEGRNPASWHFPPWRNFEQWTKDARSRLAAARHAPPGESVLSIPLAAGAPLIDGRIGEDEWRGALHIGLAPQSLGTEVLALSDGRFLYLAADVPADATEGGRDQFRFWFHIGLSPWLDNERAFVARSGNVRSMRTVLVPQERGEPRPRSDSGIYERASGATSVDVHRRFELALDLAESGISPGAAFPAWVEVEGDPVLDAVGRFKTRSNMGQAGSRDAPLWLRVSAPPASP